MLEMEDILISQYLLDFFKDAYNGAVDTVTGFALMASGQTCFVWQHVQVRSFFTVMDSLSMSTFRLSEEPPHVTSSHVHKTIQAQIHLYMLSFLMARPASQDSSLFHPLAKFGSGRALVLV
jgi:hypothetical protein